jgi:hypothetical protein
MNRHSVGKGKRRHRPPTAPKGFLVPRRDTRFAYGNRWFRSLSDAMDFAETRNVSQAHISEVLPNGTIETTQVHFVGRPR